MMGWAACTHQSHRSAGTLAVWRHTNLAVASSATASNTQRTTKPVGPARESTTSPNQAQRPLNGGAEGLSHSCTPPATARSASPTSKRTNHRVSAAPERMRTGFMMPNVEAEPRAEACRRESARAIGWAALRQLLDGGWIVKLATKLTPVTASPLLRSV